MDCREEKKQKRNRFKKKWMNAEEKKIMFNYFYDSIVIWGKINDEECSECNSKLTVDGVECENLTLTN